MLGGYNTLCCSPHIVPTGNCIGETRRPTNMSHFGACVAGGRASDRASRLDNAIDGSPGIRSFSIPLRRGPSARRNRWSANPAGQLVVLARLLAEGNTHLVRAIQYSYSWYGVDSDLLEKSRVGYHPPLSWTALACNGYRWWASAGEQLRSEEQEESAQEAALLADTLIEFGTLSGRVW